MNGFIGTLLTRCVIIGGFAMGGYIGQSVLTKQDKLGDKLDEAAQAIRVLESSMKLRSEARDEQIGGLKTQIADHEGRIRILERH